MIQTAYLDEAGVSQPEPVAVVAGLLINSEDQKNYISLQWDVIVNKFIPGANRNNFLFHSTDVFSGKGIYRDGAWSVGRRIDFFYEMAAAPLKSDAVIVYGTSRRGVVDDTPLAPSRDELFEHARAYGNCLIAIEHAVRSDVGSILTGRSNDVVDLVVESKNKTDKYLKKYLESSRSNSLANFMNEEKEGIFPLKSLSGSVRFVNKNDELITQFADICAFIIRRRMANLRQGQELYDVMAHGCAVNESSLSGAGGYYWIARPGWHSHKLTP